MDYISHKHITSIVILFILTCFFKELSASEGGYDYSHRKRDCEIRLLTSGGVPMNGVLIGIAQLSNDFAFGGTIRGDAFDTLGDEYGETFLSYFDHVTPENEIKWEYVMKCSEKCDPDFSKADFLVDWLLKNNISIFGNNLFSNENEELLPDWTRNLGNAAFKQAMKERIAAAMGHFKGNLNQWDLISEICQGEMLQIKSGDPNIFSWIMDEAHKIDPEADFIVNDYNIITSNDPTIADQFINKVKPLSSKFDIVGAGGHFGANMNKSSYEPKINYLAEQLGMPVWLTDVDFKFDINQAPDKIEELMRSCFANPNVGGLIMGSWNQRFMSGKDCTSYFVDSLNKETPTGQRWREVRAEWKTEAGGCTDDSGKFSFNGFQGNYHIIVSCYLDTFYLEPGEGTQTIEVVFYPESSAKYALNSSKTIKFIINGIAAYVKLPAHYNRGLFLTTYTLSGKQLSRSSVNVTGGSLQVTGASSCCRVFRIETADRHPLYTGKVIAVR